MATTTNKQRVLNQLLTNFKVDSPPDEKETLQVFDQFVYAICREGTSRELADQAFQTLRERFFDWNEIRVSSQRELEEVFEGMPDSEKRASRLISLLQEVFESTFSFDLESLHKKGLKDATRKLSRFEASTPFTVSWVVQNSLGGHSIPLDDGMQRTVRRLGLIEDECDLETLQSSLENVVPKSKGPQFAEILNELAQEYCWEERPNCAACPLGSECPTGQDQSASSATPSRNGKIKPR